MTRRPGGHLVVGKVVAEFGWELMSCGPLRRYVHKGRYSKVTVSTRPGREALYADFATYFKPHDIKCESEFMMGYVVVDGKRHALPLESPDMDGGAEWYEPQAYAGGSAEWFVYGEQRPEWAGVTVFHARNRPHCIERNWPIANWAALAKALREAGLANRVVCIGSPVAAMAVDGCEDARGLPLAEQMNILHSAAYAVGMSSGPMHLAQHCKCPVVVWCGGGPSERKDTQANYLRRWNVHGTVCRAEQYASWKPEVGKVASWCAALARKPGQ